MFAAEKPCINASPAGMFTPLPFFPFPFFLVFTRDSSSSLSVEVSMTGGGGLGLTIALLARLRSRRSASPSVDVFRQFALASKPAIANSKLTIAVLFLTGSIPFAPCRLL